MLHRTRTLVVSIVLGLLTACGGGGGGGGGDVASGDGDGSTPPTGPTTTQMGGARQGIPLNLSTAVTTFAGAALGQDGVGAAANFRAPGNAVVVGDSVYVADTYNNAIRRIVIATGAVTTLAGTAGTYGSTNGTGAAARFYFPQGITSDGSNLYVADTWNHTIRQIVIATGVVTTLAGTASSLGAADGTGAAARFNSPEKLTIDVTGAYLYVADAGNNAIREIVIATGAVTTLAGAPFGADGTGASARFNYPGNAVTDGTNLYVADTWNNTIRRITIATGAVTTLAGVARSQGSTDGTGTAARFNGPHGIATDGANLYVADTWNHTIRRIVIATGAVTTFAGTVGAIGSTDGTGTAARFNSPKSITADSANLYVADSGNHTIRRIVIATGAVTTLAGTAGSFGSANGTGTAARFNSPEGIILAGSNLYVLDTWNHTIRQIVIATGGVTTLAGTAGSLGSTNGTGTAARFFFPRGITSDGTNLYVADTNTHTIRRVVIATGAVTSLAGRAFAFGAADGTGAAARFFLPEGITTDGTNLYVTDTYNHNIRRIVIATGAVTTLAGGSPGADGTGAAARFNYPQGITADSTNLYVADTNNNTIRQIAIGTGAVTTLAGAAGPSGSADGIGAAARFSSPAGLTTDGANLYVADTYNNTIRQIAIGTGAVTTLAGTAGTSGSADGIGAAARFSSPAGITTDGANLYVADTGNNTLRRIVIATGAVTALAGASSGADGIGAAARFYLPQSITTDGTNLYVSDYYNHTIRRIAIATGAVTTLAGTAGFSGSADGIGAAAEFYYPKGITTDGTNLYVTDTGNDTIRQIVIATGEVTTLAGTAGSSGSADGIGAVAQFETPQGITTDGTNLYVTDTGNDTIRQIAIATGAVTTLAGTAGSSGSADGIGAAAEFASPRGITTDGTNLYVTDSGNDTIRQIVIATGAVTTLAGAVNSSGSVDGVGTAAGFNSPAGITTDGTNLYVTDYYNQTIRRIVIATGVVTTLAGTAGSSGSANGTGTAARFYYPEGVTTDGQRLFIVDTANDTLRVMQ